MTDLKAKIGVVTTFDTLPVVVFAPYRHDAETVQTVLERANLIVRTPGDLAALEKSLATQVGIIVLSQEGLTKAAIATTKDYLMAQEQWSETPIIVLLDAALQSERTVQELAVQLPRSKLILKQRPVRATELSTAVKTALRARERQFAVKRYLSRQEEMRRELNHRVKNILASVRALFELTRRNANDLDTFTEELSGRLDALTKVHAILFDVDYGSPSLRETLATVIAPYNVKDERVVLKGPEIALRPEPAMTVALCVHELATNAAKYGGLSRSSGDVAVDWQMNQAQADAATLAITWREKGGPKVARPTRKGYGTRFIMASLRRLDGEVDFEFAEAGLTVSLKIPAEKLVA